MLLALLLFLLLQPFDLLLPVLVELLRDLALFLGGPPELLEEVLVGVLPGILDIFRSYLSHQSIIYLLVVLLLLPDLLAQSHRIHPLSLSILYWLSLFALCCQL